jgi:cytochrome c biogenesis protein ResB
MLDVYTTCLLTLLFLFVIAGIVAIYGRVFQRRQKNQDPPEEDTYVEVERGL